MRISDWSSDVCSSDLKMNTAEIMTVALTATKYFGGNYERSRHFFESYGYMKMLSKSQFNRRLNKIDICIWQGLFDTITQNFKSKKIERASCRERVCQYV